MSTQKLSSSNKSAILIICCGIFLGFIIKLFIFDILHVSGRSMEPAISNNSTLAVNKLSYGLIKPWSDKLLFQWNKPECNDVVIYLYNNKIVVKRCVAVEGQLLEYSVNPVYTLKIGDKSIPLTEIQYLKLKDISEVPEGYFLAIGDNYQESYDSREYGFVSVRNALGKVICK